MTRHGKNCTAGAVYTYHEKKKDTAASGYGTQNVRLSKDAVKDFDCCCLSLQPCKDPVVTPDGYLYEKEAILEYILHQKKEIARQMKAYEKQKNEKKTELAELSKAAKESKVKNFLDKEMSIVSKPLNPFDRKAGDAQPGPSNEDKAKQLPSFWIPSLTPEAKTKVIPKPDKCVYCPMSMKPLKLKDLIPVHFTPVDASVDRVGLINRQDRYVCAVTRDMLGNSVPCAVLRPSEPSEPSGVVEGLCEGEGSQHHRSSRETPCGSDRREGAVGCSRFPTPTKRLSERQGGRAQWGRGSRFPTPTKRLSGGGGNSSSVAPIA